MRQNTCHDEAWKGNEAAVDGSPCLATVRSVERSWRCGARLRVSRKRRTAARSDSASEAPEPAPAPAVTAPPGLEGWRAGVSRLDTGDKGDRRLRVRAAPCSTVGFVFASWGRGVLSAKRSKTGAQQRASCGNASATPPAPLVPPRSPLASNNCVERTT